MRTIKIKQRLTALSLLIVASTAFSSSFFSHLTVSQHKLSTVNQEIKTLESTITATKSKRNKLQNNLQQVETQIAGVQKKLHLTRAKLLPKEHELNRKKGEQDQLRHELALQNELMTKHMLAAYALGRQSEIKLLLNQQNPQTIDRYMVYYRYLIMARQQSIKHAQKTIQQLQAVTQSIEAQEKTLLKAKEKLRQENHALQKAQSSRQATIEQLGEHLKTKQAQLKKLYSDKARLQKLLNLLNEKNYYASPGTNFAADKGHLPWPVEQVKLLQTYHAPIAGGRLRSSGILLADTAGTPIHAIYPGKVVFAHWLRGYGFLTIIQHGKHYMTLYARCQAYLLKKAITSRPDRLSPAWVILVVMIRQRYTSKFDAYQNLKTQHVGSEK